MGSPRGQDRALDLPRIPRPQPSAPAMAPPAWPGGWASRARRSLSGKRPSCIWPYPRTTERPVTRCGSSERTAPWFRGWVRPSGRCPPEPSTLGPGLCGWSGRSPDSWRANRPSNGSAKEAASNRSWPWPAGTPPDGPVDVSRESEHAAPSSKAVRPADVSAEHLAEDLTVHLAGTSGVIRAALPWIDRLPPADRAWLVGRIVLTADAGDITGLVETIAAWQDTPAEPAPPGGDQHGQRDQPPGPGRTGGVPCLTATGLYSRIKSELDGRGPIPDDLAVLCGELLTAFTPETAWE